MRQPRYRRQQAAAAQQQQVPAPQNSESADVDELAQMVHSGTGTNVEYPAQYDQQEAALMEQIIARRKAFMQRYGNAEQAYLQQGGNPAPINAIRAPSEQEAIKDIFEGDI